jgi:IS1 family transposase
MEYSIHRNMDSFCLMPASFKIPDYDLPIDGLGWRLSGIGENEGPAKVAVQRRMHWRELYSQPSPLVYPHLIKLGTIDESLNTPNAGNHDREQGHDAVGTPPCEEGTCASRYFCEFGAFLCFGFGIVSVLVFGTGYWRLHKYLLSILCVLLGLALFALAMFLGHIAFEPTSCVRNTVPQKYLLTSTNYWGTVILIEDTQMANILAAEKQIAVISALAEGSGIRQIERMTGVNRNTIMNLGVRVGKGCAALLDAKMRNLSCEHLQFDELWGFIGKKQRHLRPEDSPELGDVWTFCAIDSDTKLVPSFKVGKRDADTATAFVADVASRLRNRVQVSADALNAYVYAMELGFGGDVDFAQIVKVFDGQSDDAKIIRMDKTVRTGNPNLVLATTSHVERLNGTTRLHMRRLTRLTYAFSKKLENFEAAVGLHFAYYNFVKRHNTLRCTPAMAAGIERQAWTVKELIEAA